MKYALSLSLCASLLTAQAVYAEEVGLSDEKRAEYRTAIKGFAKALGGELKGAMKKGGPLAALDVCKTQAMPITQAQSEKNGISLSRTSLKVRNPDNAPAAWEKTVLEAFEARKAKGEDVKMMDYSAKVTLENGQHELRYMKAIPTGGVCLACHGETVAPEVEAKLKTLYPEDKARGFKLGDIRGAFSVTEEIE
jgi:hypothetical protein